MRVLSLSTLLPAIGFRCSEGLLILKQLAQGPVHQSLELLILLDTMHIQQHLEMVLTSAIPNQLGRKLVNPCKAAPDLFPQDPSNQILSMYVCVYIHIQVYVYLFIYLFF